MKAAVKKELDDAKRVIDNALAHLEGHDLDETDPVALSLNGSVSTAAGKVTSPSTGHSISVRPYQEPAPEQETLKASAAE